MLTDEGPGDTVEFERISLEQGLSQSSVHSMLQDSQGFMWFGTSDGLNKYDGYNFAVYKYDPDDRYSLSDNTVRVIYEDREGVLWIGTQDGGLDKFDRATGRFIRYQYDPNDPTTLGSNYVFSIQEDHTGVLWVGTNGGGLNRFDRATGRFTRYQHRIADAASLTSDRVLVVYEDRDGVLWVGTNNGLDQFDRETETFVHFESDPDDPNSLSGKVVLSICEDRWGELWIGTGDGGLNRLVRETGQFIHYRYDPNDATSLGDDIVWPIYEDQAGELWIGTYGGGLARFNRADETFVRYRYDAGNSKSLSSNRVSSIYQDRSGVLWIGTNGGGLNKLDRGKGFVHYRHDPENPDSLSVGDVFGVWEDREGVLWVGTAGGGLNRIDQESGRITHYRHDPDDAYSLSHDFILTLYEDRAGALWVGTNGGGLSRFERETERFIRYQNNPNNPRSLNDTEVFVIHQDRMGRLWIGTLGGGLDRFDQGMNIFTHHRHDPDDPTSLSNDWIRAIEEDESGALWVGTDKGLNRFDQTLNTFTRYLNDPRNPDSLGDNAILSLYFDSKGVLWIGTDGGGLDRFDIETGTFTHYREKDGLSNNVVYGVLEDDEGCLWLSTNQGISKFNPRTETFKTYDVRDGLHSNEFNGGAYHRGASGLMLFGGVGGLTAFYPAEITDNQYVPPVVLTSLTQGGEEVRGSRSLERLEDVTFHWPNNFFEFEFAALSYIQSAENQYAYMLEGFDRAWNYIGTRRFGKYTNLPGGQYTLRLKGSNNDGVWNEDGISLTVTIVPPFWGTWWFRGLVILVVMGGAIGGYRLRVRSIEARNRELERQVAERTREIDRRRQELEALYRADAELHSHLRLDEVLQALVDIAVDSLQADKSSVLVWEEERERLEMRVARGFGREAMARLIFARGEGITGQVVSTGEPAIVEDALTDPRQENERPDALQIVLSEGIRSFMHLPIQVDSDVFGVFNVNFVKPHAFGEDDLRLFTALAQRAALAIQNAQVYEQAQELAVMEERNRLARDLHDAVTQTLFSASLIAEALPSIWDSDREEGHQLLAEMQRLSRGALAEMRTLLLELRPTTLKEAELGDLMRQLADTVAGRKDLSILVNVDTSCDLPSEIHFALYRIAQEALNNIAKHASAEQVEIDLRCEPAASPTPVEGTDRVGVERVELRIRDDGCGFDAGCVPSECLGLSIMRERALAIGATLTIESEVGRGTEVRLVWGQGR